MRMLLPAGLMRAACLGLALLGGPADAAPRKPAMLVEEPWRVALIPLGMPLEAVRDGETLDGIYEDRLKPFIRGSVRASGDPVFRIETRLKEVAGSKPGAAADSRLDLWFSSAGSERRAFWIRRVRSFSGLGEAGYLDDLRRRFGEPVRTVRAKQGESEWIVSIFALPGNANAASLPASWPSDFGGVAGIAERDLRGKASLLGAGFRGALVSYGLDGKGRVSGESAELIDLPLAATVLNFGP